MRIRLFCNPQHPVQVANWFKVLPLVAGALIFAFVCAPQVEAEAPQWMHALVSVQLPTYDDKDDAVLLYSETKVTVLSTEKIKTQVREAYKILRPSGRVHGTVSIYFNAQRKIKDLHAWCIPARGKDFEVKDKDAYDVSPQVEGGELVSDAKNRVLQIPAPDPGSVVGYEYEVEERPFFLQDSWGFQRPDPVRESHYSLELPPNWEYETSWLNHPEVRPSEQRGNSVQWVVSDVKGIRFEPDMPPWRGVAGKMIISFFPASASHARNEVATWHGIGSWYANLAANRVESTSEIKQRVGMLSSSQPSTLGKMRAVAEFVQHEIRYVAIEIGIGGWQPHAAAEVLLNRYGDCKDKVTLTRAMLHEIGIDSYDVIIHTIRGSVTPDTPPFGGGFNHVVLAIKLPEGVSDDSLVSISQHPKLGRILFFDPTDEITPFGQIRGPLQANYGLIVSSDFGELIELPQQPAAMNSIRRDARLTLDADGTLKGEVQELRVGDRASTQRYLLRSMKGSDHVKPIETLLASSLTNFVINNISVNNLEQTSLPLGFTYSFQSSGYAKKASDLLLLRPRVLGQKSSDVLESKDPRQFPYEFEGPILDTDTFEIALPAGFEVDELPPATDADFSFGSYHSITESDGKVLRYKRSFEIKELSVPLNKMEELKRFYRIMAADERNTAVLKMLQSHP